MTSEQKPSGIGPASPTPAPGKREMRGERRVITALFCDVVNSTGLAEKLDPEDWTELMNRAFQRLNAPILRYEGTVAKLMGDAVLAFFGAPVAHEDDPQRAVLAALDMVAAVGSSARRSARRWTSSSAYGSASTPGRSW